MGMCMCGWGNSAYVHRVFRADCHCSFQNSLQAVSTHVPLRSVLCLMFLLRIFWMDFQIMCSELLTFAHIQYKRSQTVGWKHGLWQMEVVKHTRYSIKPPSVSGVKSLFQFCWLFWSINSWECTKNTWLLIMCKQRQFSCVSQLLDSICSIGVLPLNHSKGISFPCITLWLYRYADTI